MMSLAINTAWNAVSAVLQENFSFYNIKQIVGLAGFDKGTIAHLEQKQGGGASKGQLMTGIDKGLTQFTEEDKKHFLNIAIEEILERKEQLEEKLEKYLSRLGWKLVDGAVIPIEILDLSDLPELQEKAREDLVKAAKRFRDGDLSGAISSACGAVDSVTSTIYEEKELGDAGKASFQERCKVAMNATGIFDDIENELKDIDWKESGTIPFKKNFQGSLNQAAFVMQTLRSNMSDVHGTKPVFRPLVFDSIKWAEILVRIMSRK